MLFFSFATILCLILSLAVDRQKTYQGCRKGLKMFLDLLPILLGVLALVSIFLYLIPEKTLSTTLGAKGGPLGVLIAALIGSISLLGPKGRVPRACPWVNEVAAIRYNV